MNSNTRLACALVLFGAGSGIVFAQGPCGGKPCAEGAPRRQSAAKPRSGTKTSPPIDLTRNALPGTVAYPTLSPSVSNARLTAIDGRTFKLADYTGKVLLVNLWATWCGPCRLEIPELVKLHKRFKSRGVEIVGLSTEDPNYAAESVRNFIRDFKVRYRIGWSLPDVTTTLMQGRDAVPQSFVISRDGRIVKRFVGFKPTQNPLLLSQAIEEALNYKAEAFVESPTPANPTAGMLMRNNIGMELVYLPPGNFTMGSSDGEANEKPVRQVTISQPFYLGKYEVTQKQWQSAMGRNPSEFKGDNLPVETVSWDDALAFIARLNSLKDGFTYRLPTEAEWEYACRAGTTGEYAGDIDAMGWYGNNSGRARVDVAAIYRTDTAPYQRLTKNGGQTHAVGRKLPNSFGLFDMHGNVAEWCQDWYHHSYDGAPTDGSAWLRGGDQNYRVARGGSWFNDGTHLLSAHRFWVTLVYRVNYIGFRVAADRRTQ